MRRTMLEVEDVSKAFPGVQALDHVTLSVAAGEVHGLVGENGAGKSTLMAIASGAMIPDTGRVLIDQTQLAGENPAQARELGLAIVHQEPALLPDLTVAENLWLGVDSMYRPVRPLYIAGWAGQCLARWRDDHGLDPAARVGTLTPEQRFVVEICKALAQQPKVLLLDEPTEHLMPDAVDLLFARVRTLAADGCAVIYISHRIREVRRLADRVTVLRDGRDQGTYEIGAVLESQIVDLIVGRSLDATFPDKADLVSRGTTADSERTAVTLGAGGPHALSIRGFRAPRCAPLDLDVRSGEIVGLAGIDGNGQRDFLRTLGGLNRARGDVRVAGVRASVRSPQAAAAAGICFVSNDRHREGILPESSVRANVVLRTLPRVSRAGIMRRATERALAAAAVTQLDVRATSLETTVGTLSGGNQQKVVLASALMPNPKVLLVDEPTQGVDVGARAQIYSILRGHAAKGAAVLVLASDATEVSGLCDRVLVFSRGQVAVELAGDDLTEHRITESVLTSTTSRHSGSTGGGSPQRGKPSPDRGAEDGPRGASAPEGDRHETRALSRWSRDRLLGSDWAPTALVTVAIVALGLYATTVNAFFLSSANLHGVLALTATLTLAAAAQQIVMMIGGIDLSVGPLMGMLVVISSFFLADGTGPAAQLGGWLLFVAVAVVAGLVNWTLVEIARLPPMVGTLVTYMAFQGISLLLRPAPGGLISLQVMDAVGRQVGPVPVALIAAAAIVCALQFMLTKTNLGLSVRSVGSDRETARLSAVRSKRITLVAYVGCSSLAALAAIPLIAQVGSGDPSSGINYTLSSVAAAVIGGASVFGGRGSFLGCLLGALLVQEVASVTTFLHLTAAWQSYLLGGMILLAVSVYSKGRALVESQG